MMPETAEERNGVRHLPERLHARARSARERLGTPPTHAGGGVHDLRRQAQLEVRLVRRAPLPDRVQPHVGARGRDGPGRRPDRLHPPRDRASTACRPARNTPSAWQNGPRCSITSRAGASSGAPAAAPAATSWQPSTSWTPTRPKPSGTRSSARSRGCGNRSTTRYQGEHFTVPTPHNVLPKPFGQGHPPIWVACGNPPTFGKAGRARHRCDRLQLRADLQPPWAHRRLQGGHRELHRAARPVHERQHHDDERCALLRGPRKGPQARPGACERLPRDDGEPVSRHDAEVAGRHHMAQPARCPARISLPAATRTRSSTS